MGRRYGNGECVNICKGKLANSLTHTHTHKHAHANIEICERVHGCMHSDTKEAYSRTPVLRMAQPVSDMLLQLPLVLMHIQVLKQTICSHNQQHHVMRIISKFWSIVLSK